MGLSAENLLVFFPTYNEAGNAKALIESIREHLPGVDILVVDDNSPDGTGGIVSEIAAASDDVKILHRPGKLGVGSAHKLAILYARDQEYDALITMDADFSHHPRYLPEMVERLGRADFVTGSRWIEGGRCDYGPWRVLISRTANLFARTAVGLPLAENTTLYRGFTKQLLRELDVDAIRSEGYSFAVESLYEVSRLTDQLDEFPIHFENRIAGASKISQSEIFKAVITIQKLALDRAVRLVLKKPPRPKAGASVPCCVCGGTHHVEIYPARANEGALADVSPYSCATHSSRSHEQILKCLQCGIVFMRPRLTPTELVDEYADAIDPTYLEQLDARETTFRENLRRVRAYIAPSDRVLEVGSYCGGFLKVARAEGLDVTGVEPSRWAAEASRGVSDAPVVRGTLDDVPLGQPYDVIVAWDVLEHFANPVEELRKMNGRLHKNGRLLFSTLMIDNWFPRLAGKNWPWLMDMHLYYFTEESVRNTLHQAGFDVIDDMKYTHVVTLEYLSHKLETLGLPFAERTVRAFGDDIGQRQIPFRFGDIKLFVCRKTREVAEAEPPSIRPPAGLQSPDPADLPTRH